MIAAARALVVCLFRELFQPENTGRNGILLASQEDSLPATGFSFRDVSGDYDASDGVEARTHARAPTMTIITEQGGGILLIVVVVKPGTVIRRAVEALLVPPVPVTCLPRSLSRPGAAVALTRWL